MKKVVVVINFEPEGKKILEGKDLKMINPTKVVGVETTVLVVMDGKEEIAVFNKWLYWKKMA